MSLHDMLERLIKRPWLENKLVGLTPRQAEKKLRQSGMTARAAKRYLAEHKASLGLVDPP